MKVAVARPSALHDIPRPGQALSFSGNLKRILRKISQILPRGRCYSLCYGCGDTPADLSDDDTSSRINICESEKK